MQACIRTTMAYPPEPVFNGSIEPIYIPKLRNFLTIGTFVKIKDNVSVWRIVDALVDDRDFRANEFSVVDFNVHRFERGSPLAHRGSITHESARYIPEVVQTPNCQQFPPASVEDVAFVYKLEEITEVGSIRSCQGMTNAYVIRFRDDGHLIGAEECCSVPSD
jgi:hypothetical protein